MKTMKKLFALLLALTMVFGLAATGFAADTESGDSDAKGTITITKPAFETTYKAYKLLDLESWSRADDQNSDEDDQTRNGNYSYKLNTDWCEFFGYEYDPSTQKFVKKTYGENDTKPYGVDFVTIDEYGTGYVTWVEGEAPQNKTIVEFAQEALKWVLTNNKQAAATLTTKAKTEYNEDTELDKNGDLLPQKFMFNPNGNETTKYQCDLGYYLVETNLGALCSLNTTDSNAEIVEKNAGPGLEKTVKEGNDYGEKATANVGDTVEFKIVVTAYPGAENYVIHDAMTDGLTFNASSVTVTSQAVSEDSEEKNLSPTTDYEVKTTDICSTEDDESTAEKDCDFHIEFKEDYLKTITEQTTITVTYTATVNENAVIDGEENETDKNEAKLDYGDDHHTEWNDAKVYTFTFTVVKVDGTDKNNKPLAGAEFEMYKNEACTSTSQIAFDESRIGDTGTGFNALDPDESDEGGEVEIVQDVTYIVCQNTNANHDATHTTKFTTLASGKLIFQGLDAGTYYLKETKAPNGYNKLKYPIKVVISDEGYVTYWLADAASTDGNVVYTDEGKTVVDTKGGSINHTINVVNNSGTELPSTGGMGTTLFYVVGSLMVLGAAVLLVAKKRSNT